MYQLFHFSRMNGIEVVCFYGTVCGLCIGITCLSVLITQLILCISACFDHGRQFDDCIFDSGGIRWRVHERDVHFVVNEIALGQYGKLFADVLGTKHWTI